MANKIGIVLALDGEKEFTAAVQTAQKEVKLFQSELSGLSEKFDGQANSMDALTEKQKLLTQQQQAYQRKLDASKAGLEKANKNYQEAGKRLEELRRDLEQAKKAMDGMDENTDDYKKQAKAVQELEKAVEKQTVAHTREAGSIADWNKRVSESQRELNKANTEIEQNVRYLNEAEQAADHCATSIDEFGRSMEEAGDKVKETGDSLDDAGKKVSVFGEMFGANLASTAVEKGMDIVKQGVDAVKESMYDLSSASADLQAKTGLTGDALEEYQDIMKEIKGDNFGESYEEVAANIAEAVQIMGELDPSNMKEVVESAMTLQDVFDMDINETLRAVDVMTQTMGVDAQEAFDLIAAGAQNGLDRSHELVDNITEYGQLWAQSGFSAKEMFSILENGLDAGAYNLDKVNDFVKEFGISLSDGRMEENIESFSDRTQELFEAWKNGEATTADVFYSVMDDMDGMANGMSALSDETLQMFDSMSTGGTTASTSFSDIATGLSEIAENAGTLSDKTKTVFDAWTAGDASTDTVFESLMTDLLNMDTSTGILSDDTRKIFEAYEAGEATMDEVLDSLMDDVSNASTETSGLSDSTKAVFDAWEKGKTTTDQVLAPLNTDLNTLLTNTGAITPKTEEIFTAWKDGKATSEQTFTALMDNLAELDGDTSVLSDTTKDIFEAYQNGKATAQDVIQAVVGDLSTMEGNESSVLQLASEMWSALGEDNSLPVITSLTDTNGHFENLEGTLNRIKDVEYSDLGSTVEQLGATVQEKFLTPIAEAALPAVTGAMEAVTAAVEGIAGMFEQPKTELDTFVEGVKTTNTDIQTMLDNADQALEQAEFDTTNLETYKQKILELNETENLSSLQQYELKQAVNDLAGDIPELAEAWDDQTGKIDMSREAIANLIDQQAAYTKLSAGEFAKQQAENAKMAAEANKIAIDSAIADLENRIAEYEKINGEINEASVMWGSTGDVKNMPDVEEWKKQLEELTDQQAAANAEVDVATTQYDAVTKYVEDATAAEKEATEALGEQTDATAENTAAKEESAEATKELTEEEKAAAAAAEAGAEAQKASYAELLDVYHGYVDEIKSDLQDKINPFEKFDTETGFGTDMTVEDMTANLDSQIDAFQTYSNNLEAVKDHIGEEIAPEFMQYIEDMGIEGNNLLEHILQTYADGEPEKVKELSDKWMAAMNLTDSIAETSAANRVAYESAMGELGSTEFEFDGLKESIEKAKKGASDAWKGLDVDTAAALNAAVETAQKCGVKIPDGLADGIKSGETTPQTAIEQLNGTVEGAFDGLLDMAREAGINVPPELADGIDAGSADAAGAYQRLVDLLLEKSDELSVEIGKGVSFDALEKSIEDAKVNVAGTWVGMADDIETALSAAVDAAKETGAQIPSGLVAGIESGDVSPEQALSSLTDAVQAKCDELEQAATNAGIAIPEDIAAGMASGDTSQMAAAYDNLIAYIQQNADASTLESIGSQIGESFNTSVSAAADTSTGETLVNSVEQGADDTSGVQSAADSAGQTYVSALESYSGQATAAGSALGSAAYSGAQSWAGAFYSTGYSMASGLAAGIGGGASLAVNAILSLVSQTLQAGRNAAEIHSPSRKFRKDIGQQISTGLAFGIRDKASLAGKAAATMSKKVYSSATAWLKKYKKSQEVSLADERYYWEQVLQHVKKGTAAYNNAVKKLNAVKFPGLSEKSISGAQSKIQSNFGVSRTKTTGSGSNQKTETKDAEDYYKEIYSAAQKYLSNMQVLNEWSLQAQLEYWKEVKATLKKGTQAWYDAQKEINTLNKSIKDERAEANDQIIADTEERIHRQEILGKMSAQKEVTLWEEVLAGFKKGSDAWYEAKENLNDAQERVDSDRLEKYEAYVDKQQILGNMSAEQELNYWKKRLKNFKEGSDEYLAILERIGDLEEQVLDERLANFEEYVDHRKILGDMDTAQELDYWQGKLNEFKAGTDEWYSVLDRINGLREEKAQEEQEKGSDIIEQAEDFIRKQTILGEMSEERELAYWQEIIKLLDVGSDAWYDAKERINSIQESMVNDAENTLEETTDTVEDIAQRTAKVQSSILSKYKTYYDVSKKAEMQYWDIARKQFQEGTDERIEADQRYFDARDDYYDELADLDKDYADKKKDIDDDLADSIADLQKSYDDAVKSREDEIKSSMNLFEDWDAEGWDADTLLKNLDHQVQGLEFWRKQLADLSKKGLSEGLMKELEQMGPDAAANLWSLNQMTEEQLDAYQEMWDEKSRLAHVQALEDNEDLFKETQDAMAKARREAQESLAGIEADYRTEIGNLNAELSDGLRSLVENAGNIGEDMVSQLIQAVREGIADVTAEIARMNAEAARAEAEAKAKAEAAKQQQQTVQPSQEDQDWAKEQVQQQQADRQAAEEEERRRQEALQAQADAQAKADEEAKKKEEEEKAAAQKKESDIGDAPLPEKKETPKKESTKKKESDIGDAPLPQKKDTAKKDTTKKKTTTKKKKTEKETVMEIIEAGAKRSKTLTAYEKKAHGALWQYIATRYGHTPSLKMFKKLCDALGIKADASPTAAQQGELLAALKKKGYSRGTRHIPTSDMAWLMEGGKTEYIYRKADQAIMQPMLTGDKVINSEGANRLYDFAADPGGFMRQYETSLNRVNALAARGGSVAPVVNVDNAAVAGMMREMTERMDAIADRMENLEVVLDTGRIVGELQQPLSRANAATINRRNRGGLR